jgi:lipoyl(octanoyl) transferase
MEQMRHEMQHVDGNGPVLLLLEHKDTITTTRQHGTRSFKLSHDEIAQRGIEIIETDRGGDVTFHGRGQLVGYLVKRLDDNDLVGYVRALEGTLLRVTHALGLGQAICVEGKTGVWIPGGEKPRKLIAIGVGVSKGVTRHGFALNVTTDLERFSECIVPCGLDGYGITSVERELEKMPSFEAIFEVVSHEFSNSF